MRLFLTSRLVHPTDHCERRDILLKIFNLLYLVASPTVYLSICRTCIWHCQSILAHTRGVETRSQFWQILVHVAWRRWLFHVRLIYTFLDDFYHILSHSLCCASRWVNYFPWRYCKMRLFIGPLNRVLLKGWLHRICFQ